jgi:hypothetical protein
MTAPPEVRVYVCLSTRRVVMTSSNGQGSCQLAMTPEFAREVAEQLQAAVDMVEDYVPKQEPPA